LSAASLTKYLYLAYFAKPVANRAIFRTLQQSRAGNLVFLGLGDGELAGKMLRFAQQQAARPQVRFTGIDLFEMRPAGSEGLTLKQAYQAFHHSGARIRLVPGDPLTALARTANTLLETDLVLVRADQLGDAMDRAWFYLPRMLHPQSVVLIEQLDANGQTSGYQRLDVAAVERLAQQHTPVRRRAA
jgi:hypothetical protein